jgi:hypothetical protein
MSDVSRTGRGVLVLRRRSVQCELETIENKGRTNVVLYVSYSRRAAGATGSCSELACGGTMQQYF